MPDLVFAQSYLASVMLKFWDKSAARLTVGDEPMFFRLKYSGWFRLNWSRRLKLNVVVGIWFMENCVWARERKRSLCPPN